MKPCSTKPMVKDAVVAVGCLVLGDFSKSKVPCSIMTIHIMLSIKIVLMTKIKFTDMLKAMDRPQEMILDDERE